ncbi:MAG: YeeE/YedE family protein [Proteobacteria bacterium]|nr:MAG: YeeE/YedE family protein [Pseudomonadota bacterium]
MASDAGSLARTPGAAPRTQWWGLGIAALAAHGLFAQAISGGGRLALLLTIGLLLGFTLYHAAFGFTGAYHRLFTQRDTRGVEAQLVMVAAASLLFAPLLAQGELFGQALGGAVAPVGWQVAVGALLFGVGMQLGGGCGSGTLFAVGGGGARQIVTLAAFIAGSFWASLHMGWWQQLPGWGVIALGQAWGWPRAVAFQLSVLGVCWWLLRRWRRVPPGADAPPSSRHRWLRGPWPLLAGALVLAALNAVTLVVAGHPWTITWAFSLWGAKLAALAGWDPSASVFWSGGFPAYALGRGVLEDVTSVMDLGIMVGALAAAALAGRFARGQTVTPARVWAAALLGGLLMGYGARIAFGCNIGAFFSGVASTSLHGWLWIAAALVGNWLGVRLRPGFGLGR